MINLTQSTRRVRSPIYVGTHHGLTHSFPQDDNFELRQSILRRQIHAQCMADDNQAIKSVAC